MVAAKTVVPVKPVVATKPRALVADLVREVLADLPAWREVELKGVAEKCLKDAWARGFKAAQDQAAGL